jgi:hypothetical protein
MSPSQSFNRRSRWLVALGILFAAILTACSGGSSPQYANPTGGTEPPPPGTGSIAFRLVFQQRVSGAAKAMLTPTFNACVDNAIGTIAATVTAGTTTVSGASWPCSLHEGVMLGVPAGTNYTVRVSGLTSGSTPTTTWSGLASAITVTTGQVTNAGTIVMSYVGTDTTPPTVISIAPRSTPATTNVPATDRFNVAFSEPMAISTVTSTNIKLINMGDASSVPGIVSYGSGSTVAAFIPSADLASNTTYALQVVSCVTPSTCITDTAGNALASSASNTFTTETAPVATPAAPTGITAAPGNGQVTVDWLAMNGATSYNIYYGTAPGVTTTTGTPMLGVRNPAVQIGLTNGTTYYYIVTAVNGFGESPASAQASATPAFPGGNPLPPASLTITPGTGQNSLTWPAVTGATSYNLYWNTGPITPNMYAADTVVRNVTSPFTHTGLQSGVLYCYVVTAVNANGESASSMQACTGVGGIQIIW